MTDQTLVAEELYAFAHALVGRVASRRTGRHWREDAIQDVVLAGLQDYRNSGDIGLAKHRTAGRQKRLLRDDELERKHETKTGVIFIVADLEQAFRQISTRVPMREAEVAGGPCGQPVFPDCPHECGGPDIA